MASLIININGLSTHVVELRVYLVTMTNDIDILAINETKLDESIIWKVKLTFVAMTLSDER